MSLNFKSKTYRQFEIDGVKIQGKDTSKNRPTNYIFDQLAPDDLVGKDILDLGSAAGAVCFESLSRGALSATGVEIDPKKFNTAQKIKKKFKKNQVLFVNQNIIDFLLFNSNMYNTVFVLNILHHIHDPELLLNLIIEKEPRTIILETPKLPFFNSYASFKKHKRYFLLPYNNRRVINLMNKKGYKVESVRTNDFNFIGGSRRILVFRKEVTKKNNSIKLVKENSIKDTMVFIGPACSGKTYHVSQINKLGTEFSAGHFKIDSVLRSQYARLFRSRSESKSVYKRYKNKSNIAFYVNPLYRMRFYNTSIRGLRYSAKKWLKIAYKKSDKVIFLDVSRNQIKNRQLTRANYRFSKYISSQKLRKICSIAIDHGISEQEALIQIKLHVEDLDLQREVIHFIRCSYYPSIVFSKVQLVGLDSSDKLFFSQQDK
jgi:2-polyprenyl-3-methyl-5-hydroxy-6-metoxy-1,4-benzoquinol methylase